MRDRLKAAGASACIVINSKRVVLGRVTERRLAGDPEAPVELVMDPGPGTIRPDAALDELTAHLRERGVNSALVTTLEGELVGILDRGEAEQRLHEQHASKDPTGG